MNGGWVRPTERSVVVPANKTWRYRIGRFLGAVIAMCVIGLFMLATFALFYIAFGGLYLACLHINAGIRALQ